MLTEDDTVAEPCTSRPDGTDRIVLVFQGGGALGAYQAGVYHALHASGIEPEWIIGTSIGAINASLIAGNKPGDRMAALQEFWHRMMTRQPLFNLDLLPMPIAQSLSFASTVAVGIPGFFEPNMAAFFGQHVQLGEDRAGYYSTAPLERTLGALVDLDQLNNGKPRLTVGAAQVRTSRMRYFDSAKERLDLRHVMASGALPPAFPAVRIDDELYWDGGILSNTPTEVVFDDYPRENSIVFAVHMWNPIGPEPRTIAEVLHRLKDVQYSSRVASHVSRQQELHKLRHIIEELSELVPAAEQKRRIVQEMISYGCPTRLHIVRLLAPNLAYEDQTKDVDFSPRGIRTRWQAGYEHMRRAIDRAPWTAEFGPLDGVLLHELYDGEPVAKTVM
ncbi:MAG: patatin-like phospholipase family protein [Hyphomicrobiaceae bacterium]|nr:patatin-like phospholipase family protein [Hyphomicrobiaceae bacterium]